MWMAPKPSGFCRCVQDPRPIQIGGSFAKPLIVVLLVPEHLLRRLATCEIHPLLPSGALRRPPHMRQLRSCSIRGFCRVELRRLNLCRANVDFGSKVEIRGQLRLLASAHNGLTYDNVSESRTCSGVRD